MMLLYVQDDDGARLALRHEVVASTQQEPSVSRMKINSAHTSYTLFPVLISRKCP